MESICNDDTIIDSNIKEVKTASPDYTNFTEDRVLDDFKKRIGHYQEKYQPLDESVDAARLHHQLLPMAVSHQARII